MAIMSGTNYLSYVDLDSLHDDPSLMPHFIEIMPALCGVNSEIEYDINSNRLVFEQGFNFVTILPLLHRNMLPL